MKKPTAVEKKRVWTVKKANEIRETTGKITISGAIVKEKEKEICAQIGSDSFEESRIH